jgi:hypothetical protein
VPAEIDYHSAWPGIRMRFHLLTADGALARAVKLTYIRWLGRPLWPLVLAPELDDEFTKFIPPSEKPKTRWAPHHFYTKQIGKQCVTIAARARDPGWLFCKLEWFLIILTDFIVNSVVHAQV